MEDKAIAVLLIRNPQEGMIELIKKYRGLVGSIVSKVLPGHEEDIEGWYL